MEDGERKCDDASLISGANQVKKHGLLNKFLTKTYHMIDTCDPLIAGWSDDGKSFEILDVKEFSKTVLPKFFKHSKFPSFVRQLNFYSFRKLRQAQTTQTRSVRFGHKWFQRGYPELLHNIQRITKSSQESSSSSSGALEAFKLLKEEMSQTQKTLEDFRVRMDQQFQHMQTAVEVDFQQRMAGFSLSYQLISNIALQVAEAKQQQQQCQEQRVQKQETSLADTQSSSASGTPPFHAPLRSSKSESFSCYAFPTAHSPPPAAILPPHPGNQRKCAAGAVAAPGGTISPTSVVITQEVILQTVSDITKRRQINKQPPMCPLMALSMVASMDHQQEFGDYHHHHEVHTSDQ